MRNGNKRLKAKQERNGNETLTTELQLEESIIVAEEIGR